ncbi:30S ribosomal protein S7 [Candidatus Woesearchaeota archaeon]|nr:30S ribosomal protein S7 [Candidatus Woesearchaeota archaeon]
MQEIKVFGRWSVDGIKVADRGLADYITLKPTIVCRSGGANAAQKFHKSKVFIVERLMNKLMVPGHKGKKHKITSYPITGKSGQAHSLVEKAFTLIEAKTKQNPVAVFVKAVENAAPREEIISIEYGGARYPKAVECSPQRRIDVALRHMVQGSFARSFNSKRGAVDALAEEIINAYQCNSGSNAIARKLEIERQADTSR